MNLNLISYKNNIYGGANSLRVTTAVTGMKIKSGKNNDEKPVKNLTNAITIDIPLANFDVTMR